MELATQAQVYLLLSTWLKLLCGAVFHQYHTKLELVKESLNNIKDQSSNYYTEPFSEAID